MTFDFENSVEGICGRQQANIRLISKSTHSVFRFYFDVNRWGLLGITWRDKVRNEDIRKKTGSRLKKEGSDGWDTVDGQWNSHWELHERLQEKARTTEEELGRCHQTRPQTEGLDLGRSRGAGE